MNTTSPATTLTRFRHALYHCLGLRRDALFELLDAVLSGPAVTSAVRLSLEPVFRRQWASTCDALSDGSLDPAAFQRLVVPYLPETAHIGGRHLWAMDGSGWPRANAHTSPERTACRVLVAGSARHSIQDGWEFQWLVAIPDTAGSWVLPLSVARRSLVAGTPTQLAIAQVRAVQAARVATKTATDRPIVLLDSSYDVGEMVSANLDVDLLARLARNRRFVRRPTARNRLGRIPLHGPVFKLDVPATHGVPDHREVLLDPVHGTVTIERWDHLHRQERAAVEVSVIRITLAHVSARSHHASLPPPLWLVWTGAAPPPMAGLFRTWYARRFAIEHAFRFLKQQLGWTSLRVRSPQTAARWSWLLAMGWWQLWLARQMEQALRLPWERRQALMPPSPGQVRRVMARLLSQVGSPARAPKPRGNSPGRQLGQCPGRAPRFPAQKRGPPQRKHRRNPRS
jgi:hypothetical protein